MKLTPRGEWPSGKNVLGLCTWLIHITCLPPTGKCVCDPFRHTMGPVPGISEWTNEWIYTCSQFFFFFWSHHVASGILFPWSEVAQLCPTLCNPIDCSLPGSSGHGIFQAIVLEWIAISFSRGSSQPRARTWASSIVDRGFTIWATREVQTLGISDGHGGLACCGSWGRKESDTTERLNWTEWSFSKLHFVSRMSDIIDGSNLLEWSFAKANNKAF